MSDRYRSLARFGVLLLLAACAATPSAADRLHLDSGGFIDVDRWWVEDDWLMYEGDSGTIGIPRAAVLRIEAGKHARPPEPTTRSRAPSVPDEGERERLIEMLRDGVTALQERDYVSASGLFHEVVQARPELHPARVGYATSEMALGHDGLALGVVLDGLALDPQNADLLEVLGDLRYREERIDDALRSWREAFQLEPSDRLREKILKGERDQHASRDYDFATSSHFNLRYDGDVDMDLAADVMDFLEERYWDLSDRFAHAPPQPITVLLYPGREFREVTRAPEWVGGIYDGKIRVPLGGLSRLDPRAERVLTHELTHAVVHSKTRNNCPRWLQEGLAQISENKPLQRAEEQQLAELLRGRDPADWEADGFSYPAALSLTRFLESRQGFRGLVYLLELLGEGRDMDDALRHVYGEGYAALCRRWAEELPGEDRR
jgi:tetratricopeptide (TPR) repeat protein